MRLINAQNVKALAKEHGKEIHDKDLQVSGDFMTQVNDLVKAIVMANVENQHESLMWTLRPTDWAHRQLERANETLEGEV